MSSCSSLVEAAGVGPALEVRAESPVVRHDLLARLGVRPDRARDAQQLERLLERQRRRLHRREQRRGPRLVPALDHLAQLDVGPEAARLDLHVEPALGVGAEHAVVGRRRQDLLGPLDGQLVGRQVVGDGGPVLPALQVGPVAADPGHDRLAVGPVARAGWS